MRDEHVSDGMDRRGMLQCMAWVGTGLVWSLAGGLPTSRTFAQDDSDKKKPTFTFVQISDSHLGFSREPNKDVAGTLKQVVAKINALPEAPAFVLHTGDVTHLAKAKEFDDAAEVLKGIKAAKVFYVPGEHDFDGEGNKLFLERYGKGTKGLGWYSFDHKGVHFVGLVNVSDPKSGSSGGLGALGKEQLEWLKKDLADRKDSTPVVVFAHVPLWTVYEKWGWGTRDSEQALKLLKRFGSVTVLNGHVHQVLQKVEGKVTFHTARSTAFPQPAPGTAASPGPMTVPAGQLRGLLGISSVAVKQGNTELAIIDSTLAGS
jgi:3',5'-cyclic-AMP phosphodiesterase